MKWQYLVTEKEEDLARLGVEGWELVSVVERNECLIFYFKRPYPSLREQITEEQRREVYRQMGVRGSR